MANKQLIITSSLQPAEQQQLFGATLKFHWPDHQRFNAKQNSAVPVWPSSVHMTRQSNRKEPAKSWCMWYFHSWVKNRHVNISLQTWILIDTTTNDETLPCLFQQSTMLYILEKFEKKQQNKTKTKKKTFKWTGNSSPFLGCLPCRKTFSKMIEHILWLTWSWVCCITALAWAQCAVLHVLAV